MEVALALLRALADPTPALQHADRLGGGGRARLKALLHSTVFKVPGAHEGFMLFRSLRAFATQGAAAQNLIPNCLVPRLSPRSGRRCMCLALDRPACLAGQSLRT